MILTYDFFLLPFSNSLKFVRLDSGFIDNIESETILQ